MDKNAIKKFATWARRELIDRVRQQAYRFGVEGADADWNASTAHGVVLTPVQRTQRQALIERMKAKGYEATIEEVAYTWFDRLCALRFMEVNGYLPGRMRMFSDENGAFRPQILTNALNVQLDSLDLDTVIRLKEENKTEELFKYLLLTMCNALKPILTLFQPDDRGCHMVDRDYTWLLLPDNLLREGSVPEQMVLTIPEDDWKDAVQIVGWLYQYYNAEPKDQVFANLKKNIKISKKDIPAATQLFTPDWIVRYMVENSLGRLWVEGHPDHESLKTNWKYYLEEAEQEPAVQAQLAKIREGYAAIKPEDILCIDPCMGSGHILVYLFDVLVQIYEAYGYPTREAVASIVQNNLWGLDIDDRAAQLANFGVMMVARRYDKGWFRRGIQPHVMAIQESNGINRDHLRYLGNSMSDIERNNVTTQMEALLDEFIDAKEYGSILQPQNYDWEALRRFVRMTAPERQITLGEVGIDATQENLLQIIEQGQALAQKYHAVVTNPPYMNPGNSGGGLANYVKKYYPDSKTDLFAVFIEQCHEMLKPDGMQGMITMQAWMFLGSYEKLRTKLQKLDIVSIAHLGARAFDEIGGEVVQTSAFTFRNSRLYTYNSTYIRLLAGKTEDEKENIFLSGSNRYYTQQNVFTQIPGIPIAYWMSQTFIKPLAGEKVSSIGDAKIGLQTGNNDLYLKYWFEVAYFSISFNNKNKRQFLATNKKWAPQVKGGEYRKWYGNFDYVVNWLNDGEEIRKCSGSRLNAMANDDLYFREGITWSHTTNGVFGARYLPDGFLFNVEAPTLFLKKHTYYYILGMMNSCVIQEYLDALNAGMHYHVSNILTLPVVFSTEQSLCVEKTVEECVALARTDWDSFETSWDFQQHPLVAAINRYPCFGSYTGTDLRACYEMWMIIADMRFEKLKANEEELNRIFIDIYGLQDELTPEVADKDVTVRRADMSRDIRSLISYAVGCMLGRYRIDCPGLQFAGGDWSEWIRKREDEVRARKETDVPYFAPDVDGILPITDDDYFSDDIVNRFVEWVSFVFGSAVLEKNLQFIAQVLAYPDSIHCRNEKREDGSHQTVWDYDVIIQISSVEARRIIRQYFLNDFYKDHLKIYQKRPIYWMFDSGKKNGFKCLVYMHRWAKDTVARVRTDYVHEMQSRYRTAMEELTRRVDNTSGSERVRLQKQLAKIQGQDAELLKYEEKVHHLADQMIAIDLDDGVKHNYAIFEDVLAPIK